MKTIAGCKRALRGALLLMFGVCTLQACWPWGRSVDAGRMRLEDAIEELIEITAPTKGDGEVAVLGFRNGEGEQPTATKILDDHLISALLRTGVHLVVPEGSAGKKWSNKGMVPHEQFEGLAVRRVLGGRLQDEANWVYLRLFLVEPSSGTLLEAGGRRVVGNDLQELIEQRIQRGEQEASPVEVEVELHVLGLRQESGFEEQVEIKDNAVLKLEDELQIRFETKVDCQVWCFLYSSMGQQRTIFNSQQVYGGREQYGPAEEEWINAGEAGQVYTLYFIAAPRLEEDTSQLFEDMAKLIEQDEVNRFRGVEKLDQVLKRFLESRMEEAAQFEVIRKVGEAQLGKAEKIILDSGTLISSRAQKLGPAPVVVRALSFDVQ